MTAILSLSFGWDSRAAARATAGGAALFYGFGNFCALAALPDRTSVLRINRLKGRPPTQAGSVTSDPQRLALAFDWSRVPRHFEPELLISTMADFQSLGPIGFRGPAAPIVPDHQTVTDRGMRTVPHISPGVRCRSNALSCTVTLGAGERYVTARFSPVKLTIQGTDFGKIVVTPGGTCSPTEAKPSCVFTYPSGTTVTLRRQHGATGKFWIGGCDGNTGGTLDAAVCRFQLHGDELVGAGLESAGSIPPARKAGLEVAREPAVTSTR